jgi:hypothetical protein
MNSRWLNPKLIPWLLAGMAVLGPGCSNPFIAKYKVLVDTISAPEVEKPAGKSYRLVAKPSVVSRTPVQMPIIAACVNVALAAQGLFEAPPNVPADLFIEVGFGTDGAGRVDVAARETYLQLSARSNPERSLTSPTGPEIWDVRVAVLGLSPGSPIESAMPLLTSVAANYLASDTRVETQVEIPHNSPTIAAVRDAAIKSLEARYPPGATPPATLPAALPVQQSLPPPTPK